MKRLIGKWGKRTLLIFPVLLCSLGLSAQVREQIIDLPGGTLTYEEVFALIESQSEVWFGYTPGDFNVKESVQLPKGSASLGYLLDRMFDGTEYNYFISGQHVLLARADAAPEVRSEAPRPSIPLGSYGSYITQRPRFALKTNLLYDLTTTLNLGVEIALASQWTLDVPFNLNPWKFGDNRLRHLGVQPEARYWFCERFSGWFAGVHGHVARFNVGGLPDWDIFSGNMQKNRYQGYLYGGGLSVGYAWTLKNRWSMEATVGVGYARIAADKYPCANCGTAVDKGEKNYFGPTKVGLSLVYVIK